jgi:hypothetical protein
MAVALAGVCGRMGLITLPGQLETIQNPFIIGAAGVMYAVEFVADKVPFVDSFWDSFHTLIRPAAAAGMGYLAGTELGPVAQTFFAMTSGTLALGMHATKASARLAINTSPEPFSNIAASLAEDTAVAAMFWFFVKHPWLALLTIALIMVLAYFILRLLWKFVRAVFRGIFHKKTPAEIKSIATETPAAQPNPRTT